MQKCPRANQEGEGEGNHPQIKLRIAIANILNTDTTDYMANKPTERVLLDKEIEGYFSSDFSATTIGRIKEQQETICTHQPENIWLQFTTVP